MNPCVRMFCCVLASLASSSGCAGGNVDGISLGDGRSVGDRGAGVGDDAADAGGVGDGARDDGDEASAGDPSLGDDASPGDAAPPGDDHPPGDLYVPPLELGFDHATYVLETGRWFEAAPGLAQGVVASCVGTLPPGLALNAATCAVSGTPTADVPRTEYSLTATGIEGSTVTLTLVLTVVTVARQGPVPFTTDRWVTALAQGADGLYIGGAFGAYQPFPAPGVIVLDPVSGNPRSDVAFGTGFDGAVWAATVDSGFLIAVGNFTTYDGVPAPRIAKIELATGQLASGFDPGTGFNSMVESVVVAGGAIYVAGRFTTYRGQAAAGLAKLSLATGALDTTFTSGSGTDGTIYALVADATHLYVGGSISQYRGVAARHLMRLDLDTGVADSDWFDAGGPNGAVFSLRRVDDRLLVGGDFTTYRGLEARYLAKLTLPDGGQDPDFATDVRIDGRVVTMVTADSDLYIGGAFYGWGGGVAVRVAKLSLVSGEHDPVFGASAGPDDYVWTLGLDGDDLYVGGWFRNYRGNPVSGVIKVNRHDGRLEPTFSQRPGFSSTPRGVLPVQGALVVYGDLRAYRGLPVRQLAKVDAATGELDRTFTQELGVDDGGGVKALVLADDAVYVGGSFYRYRGECVSSCMFSGVMKLDRATGDLDRDFTTSGNFDNQVEALSADDSGVYVAGQFTHYRGALVPRLAKLDLVTGDLDLTFSAEDSANAVIWAMDVSPDGLYLGGSFSTYRGQPARGLAKVGLVDGALDTTFTQTTGFDSNSIFEVEVAEGAVYVGGAFQSYRGQDAVGILRLDPVTGDLDTAFSQGSGALSSVTPGVAAIAVTTDAVYLGGVFVQYRGSPASGLLKVDRATGAPVTEFDVGAVPLNGSVEALLVSGEALFAGGNFHVYRGNVPRPHLMVLDAATGAPR